MFPSNSFAIDAIILRVGVGVEIGTPFGSAARGRGVEEGVDEIDVGDIRTNAR